VAGSLPAFGITIKLASVAPEQSPWGNALNQLAVEWSRISNGQVRLTVYHNAIAGEESDVLRKMRIGQLQAGVFTSAGMKQIVPEVFSISVPFMIRSEEQLDYVMERLKPDLESLFEDKRMHVLSWSRAGWVHFFSKEQVTYPDDLKSQRLASDPNDLELQQAFKIMGYNPIPMPQPELLTSLNSGLVDAFYTSPLIAGGYQWFALAPHMLDLKVAPFLGAIIISDTTWRRIPDGMKDQLVAAAQRVAAQIDDDVRRLEAQAVESMQQYGLQVTEVTPQIEKAWVDYVSRYSDAMLDVFDPDMTQRIRDILSDFQRQQ
jgi:TRAP-type C4-dicarboxylate transport system substrate-binding protein